MDCYMLMPIIKKFIQLHVKMYNRKVEPNPILLLVTPNIKVYMRMVNKKNIYSSYYRKTHIK